MRSNLIRRTTSEWTLLHSDFLLHKKISHMLRHSSLFAKRHARLNCSLVNAFATFRCRYHLFASMPSAQISLWCGKAKTRRALLCLPSFPFSLFVFNRSRQATLLFGIDCQANSAQQQRVACANELCVI